MKMINASYGQRNKRIRKERENESERIITLFLRNTHFLFCFEVLSFFFLTRFIFFE